jgi:hypothetical protein
MRLTFLGSRLRLPLSCASRSANCEIRQGGILRYGAPDRGEYRQATGLAAMESSARFVAVLLLCHLATAEFSENRDRLFGFVEPIDTYAVVGVSVFRDLEHIGRSAVMKFHRQRIRREDIVGDVTAPLSGDVFICGRVGGQYPTCK